MAKQHFTGAHALSQGHPPAISYAPAQPGATLDVGLVIKITPRAYAVYRGTAAELDAEGLIPAGFAFPSGKDMKCWDAGDFTYSIYRSRPLAVPFAQWLQGDKDNWWLCRGLVADRGRGLIAADVYELEQEIARVQRRGAETGWSAWRAALDDARFQSLLLAIGAKPAPKARKARKG